jgi:hypothetical protein
MSFTPTICVDFDGVLHSYTSKFSGDAVIADPPVPGALRWLRRIAEVFDVVIYSSRSRSDEGCAAMEQWLRRYAREEFGDEGEVERLLQKIKFAREKPMAFLTIDDRAICFQGDFSAPELDPQAMLEFRPWNKR